jgi:hypothetical protein
LVQADAKNTFKPGTHKKMKLGSDSVFRSIDDCSKKVDELRPISPKRSPDQSASAVHGQNIDHTLQSC